MKKISIICLGALLPVMARAQVQERTLVLDLPTAIEIALDENPTIRIAELEIERQDYVRKETIGNLMPQLSVDGTYNRAVVKSDMGGGLSFDPTNTVNAAASLSVPLFVPGIYKTLKLNEVQLREAVEAARASRIDMVNAVTQQYYTVLLAEESLEVLYASERTLTQTVDETRTLYENGLASEYDFITAEVQLSNLRPSIFQARNLIDISKDMLKVYLSLPQDIEIEVEGNLTDFTEEKYAYFTSDLSGNTDIRNMEIQVELLERQFDVLKTQRMPTLGAFGSFMLTGQDPIDFGSLTGAGGGGSSNNFFWTNPVSVGLSISIPIFSGRTNVMRERQLRNNITQLKYSKDYLEENIYVQLQSSINNIKTALESMAANEYTINQAKKGYDIAKTRYDAGVGTILELNTAELSLTQARLNYAQSAYDYLSAFAEYEKLVGIEK